jgi:hypothetical protein
MSDPYGKPDSEVTALDSGPHDTFVVRIWSSDGSALLRGHIQHVRSRKRAYFATPQRLLAFIREHLQPSKQTQCPR